MNTPELDRLFQQVARKIVSAEITDGPGPFGGRRSWPPDASYRNVCGLVLSGDEIAKHGYPFAAEKLCAASASLVSRFAAEESNHGSKVVCRKSSV